MKIKSKINWRDCSASTRYIDWNKPKQREEWQQFVTNALLQGATVTLTAVAVPVVVPSQ